MLSKNVDQRVKLIHSLVVLSQNSDRQTAVCTYSINIDGVHRLFPSIFRSKKVDAGEHFLSQKTDVISNQLNGVSGISHRSQAKRNSPSH